MLSFPLKIFLQLNSKHYTDICQFSLKATQKCTTFIIQYGSRLCFSVISPNCPRDVGARRQICNGAVHLRDAGPVRPRARWREMRTTFINVLWRTMAILILALKIMVLKYFLFIKWENFWLCGHCFYRILYPKRKNGIILLSLRCLPVYLQLSSNLNAFIN